MNRNGASSFRAPQTPAEIRNVVLVGPQGTGKSALLEQLTSGQLGHVKEAEEATTAVQESQKPVSGLSLAVAALASAFRRLLGRIGGRREGEST